MRLLPIVVVAFLAMTAPASADLVSHFDHSAEGWSVVKPRTTVYRASGGNPGGQLAFTTVGKGDTFTSGLLWTGDQRGAFGHNVQFDLRVPRVDYTSRILEKEVLRLFGGGPPVSGHVQDELVFRRHVDPSPSWQHFDVPIEPGPGWTRLYDSQPATAADFERVLGQFAALRIAAVYAGTGSTVSLDNVVFEGATERPPGNTDLGARFGVYRPVQTATAGRALVFAENLGSEIALDVVATVRLPRGARSIRAPRSCKPAGSTTLTCTADYLRAREDASFEVTWKPGKRTVTQRITATVKHAGADPRSANNTATYTFRRSGRR